MKNHLITNYEKLYRIKDMLDTLDTNYFSIIKINERKEIDESTVSIVMTACNRSVQTYFTLKSISNSAYKNIQVILVDDSTTDPIVIDKLQEYNMHIELINIKNKFWINPGINYNIGFRHIRGGKVVIQNAEVCHSGDVISYVHEHVKDDEYHVFNVCALKDANANNELYKLENILYPNRDKIEKLAFMWYQHSLYRNGCYHFLTALTNKSFNKIKGFDIDMGIGVDFDDNAFIWKVQSTGIRLIHANVQVIGVHQWHTQTAAGSHSGNISNHHIYNCKLNYYTTYNNFLDLTSFDKKDIVDTINKYM